MLLNHSVIVLNSKYEYWTEVALRKVLLWITKTDKIEVIVEGDDELNIGVSFKIRLPMVVRLMSFMGYKAKKDKCKYSHERVYERDGNICQYWHQDEYGNRMKYKCKESELSIDHIVPRQRGGKNSYENCVCCCLKHNLKKKNRTPQEAEMKLIRIPVAPYNITVGEYVRINFTFNPEKLSHRYYMKKFLGLEEASLEVSYG